MATEKQIAANRKNAQKAGRKPGSKNKENVERDAAIKAFRQRVSNHADKLWEYQHSLARGAQYLFRIDKEFVKTGVDKGGQPKGYYRNKKPVRVEDPEEMRQYLEDEIVNGDVASEYDEAASYYFLVARDPNNQAIDSMLDRTFGRAKTELEVKVKLPKPIFGGLAVLTLPEGQRQLPPKKVTGIDITPQRGVKTHGQKN